MRCLNSVLCQTFGDFELIIVDDDSSDGTFKLTAGILDERITALRCQRNRGPSFCRNLALTCATGLFVVFVDADDWLDPDYLTQVWRALGGGRDVDFVITRYRLVTPGGTTLDKQTPNLAFPLDTFLSDRIVSSVWAKAFRRLLISRQNIRFPNIRYMEDSVFNVQFLLAAKTAVYAPDAFYNYSKIEASVTTRKFDEDATRNIEVGLVKTEHILNHARFANADLVSACAMRMLLLHGISRLVADYRSGFGLGFVRTFRNQMSGRFPVAVVLGQRFLRARDKILIVAFYMSPVWLVRVLAQLCR